MVTLDGAHIGRLSCNPAVGGLAKGHLVREIDALGGLMARVADAACIQFRRLNTRKGLAVQASRAQVDIDVYPARMQQALAGLDTLELFEGEVASLRTTGGRIAGVALAAFALRYFPNEYSWSKEISLIMLLWVGFLGASICAHEGKHIRMEAASRVVPENLAKYVTALGFLVAAFFCGVMAYLGWDYLGTAIELGGVYEQSGVPDYFATLAIPIAFGLTVLRFLAAAGSALMGGSYGAAVDDDLAAAQAARTAPGANEVADESSPDDRDAAAGPGSDDEEAAR